MATFFGDVLSVSSRAVDEDEEEETGDDKSEPVNLDWHAEDGGGVPCKTLIVAVGRTAKTFAIVYILQQPCTVIASTQLKCGEAPLSGNETVAVQRLDADPSVVVCLCASRIPASRHLQLVMEILDKLNATETTDVVCLTTSPAVTYKTDREPSAYCPEPVLRKLVTPSFQGVPKNVPTVETPNFIDGVPAAVLTKCVERKMRAAVFVSYCENANLDLLGVQHFKAVLNFPPMDTIPKGGDGNASKLLQEIEKKSARDSLYI